MGEFASKAATAESTAGLLKMDDPSVRADTPSPIAAGSYRVLGLRTALLAGKLRGVFTALVAGGLGLAVLAGLVTCPTCDHVHAHGPLDVERIAAPIATAAISPSADQAPVVEKAVAASTEADKVAAETVKAADKAIVDAKAALAAVPADTNLYAGKLPGMIEELTNKGPPQVEIAAATVGSQPEPPLSPVANTTLTSKNITAVEPEGPALRAGAPRHVSIKARRAKARIPANKYSQAPVWAAKMFETNWQDKAFAYQYETHSLNRSRSSRKS